LPRSRRVVMLVLLLCVLIAPSLVACQTPSGLGADLNAVVAPYRFNALAWEACALLGLGCKDAASPGTAADLDDAAALEVYFSLSEEQRAIESRLRETANEGTADVRAALREELADIAAQRAALRDRVETIIARQIRTTLADEGIHNPFEPIVPLRFAFPPVGLRIEHPPTLLVISPRDRIESIRETLLIQGMPTATREEIEAAVARMGYSGLVVDLGGLAALYPPLIDQGASLDWTVETATHEWLHQYLAFTPLGFRYVLDLAGLRPDYEIARMNETVASMMGSELSQCVMEAYSPEPQSESATEPTPEATPDTTRDRSLFNRTMRETRLRVDELLAAGRIEEAEAYMEEQRLYLASEGYYIRKLNQAYFAFHGTYADAPTSVDPIGNEMRALRQQVGSPREFLDAVSTLTSRAELQQRLAAE
jgi:predicted small secreted protein